MPLNWWCGENTDHGQDSDPSVNLYYRKYSTELVGEKYLCMVIKTKETDVFMLTAYFTDAIKKGDEIWKNI